ncbi:GNAT family N-acetyltransferase [Paraclostridium bifermentans]|uniref:GNAT family N-acetyltransferase n=1 Tax=Paraclostridium bifermentans TaxID=1490 RepID=UPI001652724D|nr:GNAT family N-acetyltransferase [Paraclostridium bifermentans]MDU3804493.1 GNAT family N-acetyltransferase [Paraclostridium bifermentans]
MNEISCKFPIIETDRLILRELKTTDINDLFEILSSESVTKYYGKYPMENLSEAEDLILKFHKAFYEQKSIRWGIELKEPNRIIGTCGFHCWNKNHFRAEVGYELGEAFWNKGYATEAISSILIYGFEFMDLKRIEAIVYPENNPSEKLLLNLGFEHEGLLKKYANFRDRQQDLNIFAILKSN